MNRTSILAVTAVGLTGLLAGRADAQLQFLRHHSTIQGDIYSGASEYVRAQGAYAKDVATAAETWVRVEVALENFRYLQREHHYQSLQLERQYFQDKRDDRKAREVEEISRRLYEARRMWADAQQGGPRWPQVMLRPEFSNSLSVIGSVLRNWSPDQSPLGDPYRRALATEVGVLRGRIERHPNIDFVGRSKAVRTLNNLEMLALIDGKAAVESPRLAMQ